MTASILTLDISRLLSRSCEVAPTGIDRVELAYAEYLLRETPERAEFAAFHPVAGFGILNFEPVKQFITLLTSRWQRANEGEHGAIHAGRRALRRQILLGLGRRRGGVARRGAYLLLSHQHLNRSRTIARTLARRLLAFVPMVHDPIPTENPEYARPREAANHARRLETVARFANGVLVPSEVVRQSVLGYLRRAGRPEVPVCKVAHGVHPQIAFSEASRFSELPYFVCLSTIEPRKNHLLLLNIWRRLVELHGDDAPRLILIGRRGWENENAIDMIERCHALQGVVVEYSALPDAQVTKLLRGARALLFPSFVEGFGLPLVEALALGVPAICSDIPVFREIGGAAAELLDPIDGLGWLRAIQRRSFLGPPLPRPDWQPKLWHTSVAEAIRFIDSVTPARA